MIFVFFLSFSFVKINVSKQGLHNETEYWTRKLKLCFSASLSAMKYLWKLSIQLLIELVQSSVTFLMITTDDINVGVDS